MRVLALTIPASSALLECIESVIIIFGNIFLYVILKGLDACHYMTFQINVLKQQKVALGRI